MKTIVIYHRSDFDGIFCREIAKKFLPDAELIGWDYGDQMPQIPLECQLYMLDISIDGTLMQHPHLVWIDHHKSAMEKFLSTIAGYRIDGVAACRLAWQWFSTREHQINSGANNPDHAMTHHNVMLPEKQAYVDRKVEEPLAVRLAGEYDIWDKRDPDAELFQHGLRTRDIDSSKWGDSTYWEVMLSDTMEAKALVNDLLVSARYVQYAKTQENAGIITSYGFDVEFEGLKFLACNHARFNSHLFTAGIRPDHDALLGFNWSGKEWRVSLYHAPGKTEHDLSLIAVKHGGGGHRGACGFKMKSLPWLT